MRHHRSGLSDLWRVHHSSAPGFLLYLKEAVPVDRWQPMPRRQCDDPIPMTHRCSARATSSGVSKSAKVVLV